MSMIANAPLWFHAGIGMAVLLLSALSLVAWRLNSPGLSIQLGYLMVCLAAAAADLHNGAYF